MEVFAGALMDDFFHRVAIQARKRLKSILTDTTDEALMTLILRATGAARAVGILTERSIWRYFHLALKCADRGTMTIECDWPRPSFQHRIPTATTRLRSSGVDIEAYWARQPRPHLAKRYEHGYWGG